MAGEAQTAEAWQAMPAGRMWLLAFLARLRHHPLGVLGLIGVVLFVVMAVFGGWIAPCSPTEQSSLIMTSPSLAHPFGTDGLGRDVLSRVIAATSIELRVGLASVFAGVALATVLGLLSGYLGGAIDAITQRVVDAWLAFPPLILLLLMTSALTVSARSLIVALTLGIIPGTSRVVRGAVMAEKNNAYVEAARSIGASRRRIMLRHILPQIVAPIIVIISIMIPVIALLGAALSFLGLGLPVGQVSWGGDLGGDALEYFTHAPWMAIFPGAALSLYVLSFNMLGDAIRDILDPRLRGSAAMR
ncbi:MAG: ABC transporter permease [Dehalococcoidia bacterium]|jgi:ABC-type dipeptide/oligopeptide/nickel transport system permease subunit